MSTLCYALTDSTTMLRRQLRHLLRYPSMTLILIVIPVVFLLIFVYVFGATLGAGLGGGSGGGSGGRSEYVDYVTPGIILMTVAAAAQGTAISVAMDMTEGIVARFRTMAISRASMLTGHVVGSLIQTMLGMVSKSVETASNLPMPLVLLPFLSSGFVPTDSLPAGLGWFAEYQPFTPIIETLRGLLLGTPIGNSAVLALAWSGAIALVGHLWARSAYNRDPAL